MKALAALSVLALTLAVPGFAGEPGQFRVLVQNVYGRREKDCSARQLALAAHILAAEPPYDAVIFNEHWRVPGDPLFTCDADGLTRALEADGRYAGKGRSFRHQPAAGRFEIAGGNSIFTRHLIMAARSAKFRNGRSFPLSGYSLARIEIEPATVVDLWAVHLEAGSDGCDDACRLAQARALAADLEAWSGTGRGAPGAPVVVAGDFNTGGPMAPSDKPPYQGNGGYGDLRTVLREPRDLGLELSGGGEGFTYDCLNNRTAPSCKYRERIDFVFLPEAPEILRADATHVLVPVKIEVVRWKTPAGLDISDHYGLDAVFELRKKAAPVPGSGTGAVPTGAGD